MSNDALKEKTTLQHALKTEEGDETELRAEDIGRMKRLAGITQKLEADKEAGNVDFNGIFTGVASGDIPVSEGDYAFLKSLTENEKEIEEKAEELDEYSRKPWDGDVKKSKNKKDVDEAEETEEVDEAKDEDIDESELNRLRELSGMPMQSSTPMQSSMPIQEMGGGLTDDDVAIITAALQNDTWEQDVENNVELYDKLFAHYQEEMPYGTQKARDGDPYEYIYQAAENEFGGGESGSSWPDAEDMGPRDMYDSTESQMFEKGSLSRNMIEMIVDEMNKGKETEEISEELSFDVDHVAKVVEFVRSKNAPMVEKTEEVDEAKDEEVDEGKEWVKPWEKDKEADEDKEEVDESNWWDKGSNETERLRELAGLKAESFNEVKDEEVDEAKEEDLDEDAESYLANRDRVVKEKIAAATGKEEIDETGDEEVDEAEETEEIDEDLARIIRLSGIK